MENLRIEIPRSWNGMHIHLNIFKLNPHIEHINQLDGINGLQFYLSPNSNTEMEFDMDDYLFIPLLSYRFWFRRHSIRKFNSEETFNIQVEKFKNRTETDINNLDFYIKRWYQRRKPLETDWQGFPISQNNSK